ncbi:hypothetical protein [Chondromyces crocatus]|uniref:Acetyltransferase n=1 Tax=Chondromyces crocatus TaxID=52 RepID=A0A0K1E6G9_CHOCO|nr:hypothetical protein [Chondromyces crocatus]AKT36148.1 uncharacterized protein CMC5_002620 [Chondromyces crocatus]
MRTVSRCFAVSLLVATLSGCVTEVTLDETPSPSALGVGESRDIELRFLRFDVEQFKQSLTLDDLQALPTRVLEDTWLLDLDMSSLVQNSLQQVAYLPPAEAATLAQPARNLWKLLNLTAESTDLRGTRLEPLLGVGKAVGLPPSLILADLAQVNENDALISTEITARAVLDNVVATHPNAQLRKGPKDAAHPDGLHPVTPGAIPVYLIDVVNSFAGLAERFGPAPAWEEGAPAHPGFVVASSPVSAATEAFRMTVKVDLNALPYKGVDATNVSAASVNSTGGQIDEIFDFSQPDWLALDGLAEDLRVGELTMAIGENAAFLPSGDSREPLPRGNSPVWQTPPWEMEHILATAGYARAQTISAHCTTYAPQGTVEEPFEAVEVCMDETGWVDIRVDPSVILEEPPPPPSYFWDVLLEVAQVRLHDGGLSEGDANVEITVREVPVGVSTETLVTKIRENIQGNPAALRGVAEQLNDNTTGDADFYYYRTSDDKDWLYFIAASDLRLDEEGNPVRAYGYVKPGFYADAGLSEKVSTREAVDGDATHEKVRIEPGASVYFEDDQGAVYRIDAGDKPSRHRIALTLTRTR